jgi:hypothetical protein
VSRRPIPDPNRRLIGWGWPILDDGGLIAQWEGGWWYSELYDAMPDGFEAAVRENIRLALTSLA